MAVDELGIALQTLARRLAPVYGDREAFLVAGMCLEKITGIPKHALKQHALRPLTRGEANTLAGYSTQLLDHRPVQYVLEEAWFQDMPFRVKEGVLIPRPETEELVEWVVAAEKSQPAGTRLIDIGTGSGCIAISLSKKLPHVEVTGADISEQALGIARENSRQLSAKVEWLPLDFLTTDLAQCPRASLIVSNPPYIPLNEKATMPAQVVRFEPQEALFVPDNDPLVFYRRLADYLLTQAPGARLYVEIHEKLGHDVVALFNDKHLSEVELRQDMQGKDRMVRATR